MGFIFILLPELISSLTCLSYDAGAIEGYLVDDVFSEETLYGTYIFISYLIYFFGSYLTSITLG